MLEKAEKFYSLSSCHGVEFFSILQRSARSRSIHGFSVKGGLFKFFFPEQAASFMISFHFRFAEVVIMVVEPTVSLSLSLSLSCWSRRVCCSKRESESPESYLDGRGDGCFLVSHAGRRDDDRGLQSKTRKRWRRLRCHWNRTAAVSSPFSPWLFETSGRCHSIMPSLFILFIYCWKIQFILFNN